MVHERIHIICGNCGQDLTEKGMATWQYMPAEIDEETAEVYDTAIITVGNTPIFSFLLND